MALAGFVDCQGEGDDAKYSLNPTQSLVFLGVNSGEGAFAGGVLDMVGTALSRMQLAKDSLSGNVSAGAAAELSGAVDEIHRFDVENKLCQEWIPAIEPLKERLAQGTKVLEVACGRGAAAMAIAAGFPKCTVLGIDTGKLHTYIYVGV